MLEIWKKPNCSPENYDKVHICAIPWIPHLHGAAIDECFEDQNGELFVNNGEYGSQVNFCPMCGYKAPKQIEVK